MFSAMDKDGSGSISKLELKNSLSHINYPEPEWADLSAAILKVLGVPQVRPGEDSQKLFNFLDVDGDGEVTPEEWAECLGSIMGGGKAQGSDKIPTPLLPLVFEISASNVDKPSLSKGQIHDRVSSQFVSSGRPVVITAAPRFIEKARLFPNCTFIVGADTVKRMLNKKYYSDSSEELIAAIAEIAHLGCRFLVGGREVDGKFLTLADVLKASSIPTSLHRAFIGLSSDQFRVDISSSEIRGRSADLSAGERPER